MCLFGLSGGEACLSDSDCFLFQQCCNGDCISHAEDCSLTGGAVAGIVVTLVIVCAIVVSIISCFWCACCPWYRYRSPGAVIITGQPPYQQFTSVTTTINPPPNQLYPQQFPPMQNPPPPGSQMHPPPYVLPSGVGPAPPHGQFLKQ